MLELLLLKWPMKSARNTVSVITPPIKPAMASSERFALRYVAFETRRKCERRKTTMARRVSQWLSRATRTIFHPFFSNSHLSFGLLPVWAELRVRAVNQECSFTKGVPPLRDGGRMIISKHDHQRQI